MLLTYRESLVAGQVCLTTAGLTLGSAANFLLVPKRREGGNTGVRCKTLVHLCLFLSIACGHLAGTFGRVTNEPETLNPSNKGT
jgi:hypothetical protein